MFVCFLKRISLFDMHELYDIYLKIDYINIYSINVHHTKKKLNEKWNGKRTHKNTSNCCKY